MMILYDLNMSEVRVYEEWGSLRLKGRFKGHKSQDSKVKGQMMMTI